MLLNQARYISAPAQRTAPANAADHCFVDIAGAVKKQKKRLHPGKERMQPFLWYNVIVQKQNPQEHYTAYQLKLPVEIEKIEISDPVYSYSEVMDHIDLNKYLTIEERRPGRPRYDQKTLLKIILFAFMENGYASVREIEKCCKTDIRYMWLLQDNPPPSHMTIAIIIISTAKNTAWKNL